MYRLGPLFVCICVRLVGLCMYFSEMIVGVCYWEHKGTSV